MKKQFLTIVLFISAALLASASLQAQTQGLPEITEEGLHLVPDSKMAVVYAAPGADLAPYAKVQLLDAYVAFKKNWARDQRSRSANPLSLSSKNMEQIKTRLAAEFREVFTEVLESGGFPVVNEAGDDVLLVRPAIINLDPTAPETPTSGRSTSFVQSAGEMTLYIEIYDSVSGALIAKALDRKIDKGNAGYYTWANSVTNKVAAERILKGWANILLETLNEARQESSQEDMP